MISDNAIFRLIWIYPEVGIFLPPWQIFTFMHKEAETLGFVVLLILFL